MVTLKAPQVVVDRYSELASHLGRSRHATMLLALAVFDQAVTLNYLRSPEAAAELGDAERQQAAKQVRADLEETLSVALRRPLPPSADVPLTPEGGDPELN